MLGDAVGGTQPSKVLQVTVEEAENVVGSCKLPVGVMIQGQEKEYESPYVT